MTHVVTNNCIACKYTDCVEMCPVDCFHEGPNFLVINPDECIDCGLCVSECPVQAIKELPNLRAEEYVFAEINEKLSKIWPVTRVKQPALNTAHEYASVPNKLNLLMLHHKKD